MVRNPKTESERIGAELITERETYGLYDRVKIDTYEEWEEANDYLRDIEERDLPVDRNEIQYMYYGPKFVAKVRSLYRRLANKIPYIKGEDGTLMFKELYELDNLTLKDTTFKKAEKYFKLETTMLEKLGITKYEVEKLTLDEKVRREAFED